MQFRSKLPSLIVLTIVAALLLLHSSIAEAREIKPFVNARYSVCLKQNVPQNCPQFNDPNCETSLDLWNGCLSNKQNVNCNTFNKELNAALENDIFDRIAALACYLSCEEYVNSSKSSYFVSYIANPTLSCMESGLPPSSVPSIVGLPATKNEYSVCQNNCSCAQDDTNCESYFENYYNCTEDQTNEECKIGEQYFNLVSSSAPLPFASVACSQSCQPDMQESAYYQLWNCSYVSCLSSNFTYPGPKPPDDGGDDASKLTFYTCLYFLAITLTIMVI